MTDQFCKGDIEQMHPKLVSGVTVTKFATDIHFVQFEGRFVKLDDADAGLISEFNGSITLADIIAKKLNSGDSGVFNRMLSLIIRLNKAELFDHECASVLRDAVKSKPMLFDYRKKLGTFMPEGLCVLTGRLFTSIPGLVILAFLAMAAFSAPYLKGLNLLKELTGNTLSPGYAYLTAIIFIWIVLVFILSVSSFISGAGLSAHGISAPVFLRFRCGLISFYVDPAPIVSTGRAAAVKHYLMLMLVPFSIAGIAAILWQIDFFRPAMAIIHIVAVAMGLLFVSPLLKSPFTMLVGFFVPGNGRTSTFIRRRFLKDLLTTRKNTPETDRLILLSVVGLLWLYAIYEYFWYVARATLSYLLAETLSASGLTLVLIGISLAFIVLPIVFLAAGALVVVLGNIGGVAQTPLARMRRLADGITSKNVPAKTQIVAFLQQIPLFSGLDETELAALCSHIRLHRYGAKRKIIQQGDTGDCFYTIVSGSAVVIHEDAGGKEKVVETLSTGDSFGEIALLEKVPRTASIVTKVSTAVFEINRDSFEKFVVTSAGGKDKVTDMIRLGKLLISVPLFSFMSSRQLSAVVMRLGIERISAGMVFFNQGDKGDKFYLIKEGTVHIRRTEENKIVLDKTLEQGQFFGEMALIREIPRTAKATAVSECIVATLTKEQFRDIIGHSLFSGRELDAVMHERASQLGKEALKSCL